LLPYSQENASLEYLLVFDFMLSQELQALNKLAEVRPITLR